MQKGKIENEKKREEKEKKKINKIKRKRKTSSLHPILAISVQGLWKKGEN